MILMSSLFEFQIFLKIIKLVNKSKTSSLVYFGIYLFDKKKWFYVKEKH